MNEVASEMFIFFNLISLKKKYRKNYFYYRKIYLKRQSNYRKICNGNIAQSIFDWLIGNRDK
jgi:hypothetical protein